MTKTEEIMQCCACGRDHKLDTDAGVWIVGRHGSGPKLGILIVCEGCGEYMETRPDREQDFLGVLMALAQMACSPTPIMDYFLTHHIDRVKPEDRKGTIDRRVLLFLATRELTRRGFPSMTMIMDNVRLAVRDATEQEVIDCLHKQGFAIAFEPGTLH